MLITFLSRFSPALQAACVRLRLNHGKTQDVFGDIRFLIDHYFARGELDRAEALSIKLLALAEEQSVSWSDPEIFSGRKSRRYQSESRRHQAMVAFLLIMPIFLITQHQFILTYWAKNQMRAGRVHDAIPLLRSELAIEDLYGKTDPNVALSLADALICDLQLPEASLILKSQIESNPKLQRARFLDLQIALLTGQGKYANRDALLLTKYISKRELISTLILSNVLNGHGPYTDFETMIQLSHIENGIAAYDLLLKSEPETEKDQKLCVAMGYLCKARNDNDLASRWFKQSFTLLRGRKFKSDQVRFIDSVKQYVDVIGHSKPIEARRLEWTAMGIARQNQLPYESFEDKSRQDELSLLQ